jgi:hypothetical protein
MMAGQVDRGFLPPFVYTQLCLKVSRLYIYFKKHKL